MALRDPGGEEPEADVCAEAGGEERGSLQGLHRVEVARQARALHAGRFRGLLAPGRPQGAVLPTADSTCQAAAPQRYLRTRPWRSPVCRPSATTIPPFTITCSMPSGWTRGSRYVVRSATRDGSKTTRSA